jgi:hypothetical protein
MKTFITTLFITTALADVIMPPTDGKFFYADFPLNTYKGMHSVSLTQPGNADKVYYMYVSP